MYRYIGAPLACIYITCIIVGSKYIAERSIYIYIQTVYRYTSERGATGSSVLSTGGATDYTEYALTASARITRVIKKKKKTNREEGKKK